jgi:hypothetical protein
VMLREFEEPNRKFHEAVGKIKKNVAAGGIDAGTNIYWNEMVPNMNLVFMHFDRMIALANEASLILNKGWEQLVGPVTKAYRAAIELLNQIVEYNRNIVAGETDQAQSQASFS